VSSSPEILQEYQSWYIILRCVVTAQKAIKARWRKTTKAERSESARKAAQARWARAKAKQPAPKS